MMVSPRGPVFRPWPGDKVTIAVSRPSGTNGQTLTIDASRLELRPGTRVTATWKAAATRLIAI